jgi:hypothetical protein
LRHYFKKRSPPVSPTASLNPHKKMRCAHAIGGLNHGPSVVRA